MPLHVAIGAVVGVTGGPATYAVELVHALATLDDGPALELTVLTDRPDLFADLAGVRVVDVPLASSWRQPWWDNVAVPRHLRALAPDVYHGTKHALPLLATPARTAQVVTIHDLAVLAEPETFARAQRLQLLVHLRHAARAAQRVICVSRHAAGDVEARLGIPAERIAVVPHGVSARFRPLQDQRRREAVRRAYGAAEGFLVSFVGTAQPRKRIEVAVEAVARLRAEGLPIVLVIAGRRRPGYTAPWLEQPPPFVRLLGEVDAERLVELYGASDAMVSPSSFEGFGLTFVEAMACGCPVIGVAATSVPEVVGEGGLLVERPDAGLVADALARLLRDRELWAAKSRSALARAGELSWRRAAERTRDVYLAAAAARRDGSPA
ncbi:MAG TPA: glycosyltransferase family 1 protein [Candidatus Binatia bacterium]